jgi:hypothetical protein
VRRRDPRRRQLLAAAHAPQGVALVGPEHEEDHVPRRVQRRVRERQPLRAVRRRGGHAAALLLVAGIVAREQARRVAVGAHP